MAIVSFAALMWLIPDALFTVGLLVVNIGIIQAFDVASVDVAEAEAVVITQRAYYSPNSFTYKEPETGRFHHGIIDKSKLQDQVVENSVYFEKVVLAGRWHFAGTTQAQSAYIRREKYEKEWVVFAVSGLQGRGIAAYSELKPVLVDNERKLLESVVLMPR